jgi:hypothetical protein
MFSRCDSLEEAAGMTEPDGDGWQRCQLRSVLGWVGWRVIIGNHGDTIVTDWGLANDSNGGRRR